MLIFVFRLVVSAGFLVFLASSSDWQQVNAALIKVGLINLLTAAFILTAMNVLLAWRWSIIAQALRIPLHLKSATPIVLIGTFFNQILPSAIGGDAIRALLLAKQDIGFTQGIASIFLDRICALFGMFLIALCGFSVWDGVVRHQIIIAESIFAMGMVIVVLILYWMAQTKFSQRPQFKKILSTIHLFVSKLREILINPLAISAALLLSIIIHAIVSVCFLLLANSIGIQITFFELFVSCAIALILSVIPISAAGWGVREGALIILLGSLGVSGANAMALSVSFGIASLLSGIPGVLIWLLMKKDA